MGRYINIGNAGFQSVRNGEYVDKPGLIAIVNDTLSTEFRFSCISRCRRFGKSVTAKEAAHNGSSPAVRALPIWCSCRAKT